MRVIRDLISYRLHVVANLLSRGAELRYRRQFGVSLWEWRTVAHLGAASERDEVFRRCLTKEEAEAFDKVLGKLTGQARALIESEKQRAQK